MLAVPTNIQNKVYKIHLKARQKHLISMDMRNKYTELHFLSDTV